MNISLLEKLFSFPFSTMLKKFKKPESTTLAKKPKRSEKCENCKRCWGFCDFLKTSWKLFKEFSADTSIHG